MQIVKRSDLEKLYKVPNGLVKVGIGLMDMLEQESQRANQI
jgi:hypothetical protein